MLLVPGARVDRFEVVRLLGEGGLARVFLVRHRTLRSLHALKVLHVQSAKASKRFLQEGRIQAGIRHPNVVAVTDAVELDGAVGLVMEYVEGTPLCDVLGHGEGIPRKDLPGLFRELAAGVMAAHHQGVLHRDLKPGNVLLTVTATGLHAKIADFGIAKVARELQPGATVLTEVGTAIGTPGYMAPEQLIDASTVDARADVFSLACILYEMACGRPPFLKADRAATFSATLRGEHTPLRDRDPSLPERFCAAVERGLAVDAADRWDTVADFATAVEATLAELVASEPARTPPSTPGVTIVTPEPSNAGSWTGDVPEVTVPAPRRLAQPASLRDPPRTQARTDERPLLRFDRGPSRGRVGALSAGGSLLVVALGVGLTAREATTSVVAGELDATSALAALDAPWQETNGPIAGFVQKAPGHADLVAAAEALRTSTKPEARLAADAALTTRVRDTIGGSQSAGATDDVQKLAALHALDTADAVRREADAALRAARDERATTGARLAVTLGWLPSTSSLDATALDPLPPLAMFAEPEPPVATAKRHVR